MTKTPLFPPSTTPVKPDKPAKPRSDDHRKETLAQFSAQLDAHFGEPSGFADTVMALYVVRAQIARLTRHRQACSSALRIQHDRGVSRVLGSGGTPWELRVSKPTAVVTKRYAPSDRVKKADAKLWAAAKVPKPFLQVKSHPVRPLRVEVPADISTSSTVDVYGLEPRDLVEHIKGLPPMAPLKETEQAHHDALDKIAANAGWDGLPIEFADFWLVGLRRVQFDSDRLREIDPDAWERMAVDKQYGGTTRLYIANLGGADASDDGLTDLDEIDGE